MFRYGIVSTASIVGRFVKGIRESKEGEVYAIASRSFKKAKQMAIDLDIPHYYGSYEDLYQDPDIDIIYIPTVNGLHYRDCKQALMHGKHVIVEKPFCLKREEAIELFELAKAKQCFLMEAQKIVFLPVTQKVKEIIQEGRLGKIFYIELKAGFPSRFPYDHWMYDLSMGGGALYGSATYTIEYMQYLFDDPDMEIRGDYLESPTGSDEVCHFLLKWDHILVSSTITMDVPLKNEAVFYGNKGMLVVPSFWKADRCYLIDDDKKDYKYPTESEFVYEVKHIHECLKNGLLESPIMSAKRTIETVSLVETLYQKWEG